MSKAPKVLEPAVGILITPEVVGCCKDWTDVYVLPYWDYTHVVGQSTDAMAVSAFCPMCGRELKHTKEFDVEHEISMIPPGFRLPYIKPKEK